MSAAPERRCSTGRSPGGWAVGSCSGSRTPTRPVIVRSGPSGIVDALAWLGIGADDPTFEGPYFQSVNAAKHVAAAERLFAGGHAYYCDLTAEQVQERAKASGRSGYDGYSRDRGLGPGPGRVLRFRVARTGRPSLATSSVATSRSRTRASRTSCCCAATGARSSSSPTSSTTSTWGSPTSCAATSICPTPPSNNCCGRPSATTRPCGRTFRCW